MQMQEIIETIVSKSKIYNDIAAGADDDAAAADFHFQFLSLRWIPVWPFPTCAGVGHGSRLGQASAEGSRDPSGLKDPMQNGRTRPKSRW